MKRFAILLIAALTTFLAIAAVATSSFSLEDKHSGYHKVKDSAQNPQARVDGAVNPELIPDSAAYEILFRLLSSSDPAEQKREERKSAYLKGAGFSNAEAAALTNAAYEYKRQIDPLDAEVDEIKQANWPTPSTQVMSQLAQLQRQKEGIIDGLVRSLENQLVFYNPTKLRNHITGEIKRKTKGFGTALPTKKVGRLENFFSDLFTVSAQGPGCDVLVYLYNNVTVDWDYMTVYGTGSYSLPYNNCGHSITLATSLSGPLSTYIAGGEGVSLSLQYGSSWLDGGFSSNTEAEGYCPVVFQSFYVGSMADSQTVNAWVRLVSGSSSPNQIFGTQGSGAATFNVQIIVSLSAAGKTISISPGVQIVSGDLQLTDISSNPGDSTITISSTSFAIDYSANTTARAGVIKPSVDVSSGSAEVRPMSPANVTSSNTITVNNP